MQYLDTEFWSTVDNNLVGHTFVNTNNKEFIVIDAFYNKVKNAYKFKVKFLESGFETIVCRPDIKKGLIRDRLEPEICGVASLGYASKKDNLRAYNVWYGMLKRCYNEYDDSFKNYGAKGVTVCERWLRFDYFIEDIVLIDGYNKEKFFKGEIELDKDIKQWHLDKKSRIYSMETCVFTSRKENDLYREHSKSNAIKFIAKNNDVVIDSDSIASFCEKYNLNSSSISRAIKLGLNHKGWVFERIVN